MDSNLSVITGRIELEYQRLLAGNELGKADMGLGTEKYIAICNSNADSVLKLAKKTLSIVHEYYKQTWPEDEEWIKILPEQFVKNCGKEMSYEEFEIHQKKWVTLSREEQLKFEREAKWAVSDWISWMAPDNDERLWIWWNANVVSENRIDVEVAVYDWPYPWGALRWLFRGSGAVDLIEEDEFNKMK